MRLKSIAVFLIIWLNPLSLSAQNFQNEKPKIIDFGKSLRQTENEIFQNKEFESEDSIKIETSLVRADILVLDQKGKAVLGLTSEDFTITENDVPQEIETFALGDNVNLPRSIVLIIDYSGSQLPYIATSIGAARTLINKLNPKDRMAIVTDDVRLLTEFTRDKNLLKEKLDSIAETIGKGRLGKSLQYSALTATLNELFDNEDIRPIVIFQTDGDEFTTLQRDIFKTVEKSRATIYSIISGTSFLELSAEKRLEKTRKIQSELLGVFATNHSLQLPDQTDTLKKKSDKIFSEQESMEKVAQISGGFVENLEKPNDANKIYSRILSEINNRYFISYYPLNQEHDGKRRNVRIEVKNHPEYIVLGRKFYYSPPPKK